MARRFAAQFNQKGLVISIKSLKILLTAALAGALTLGAFSSAQALVPAQSSESEFQPARFLKGTWVGKGSGYRTEGYKSNGDYKFVISQTRGFAAKGTKQYRDRGSRTWSTPETAYFTLLFEDGGGLWQIYGAEGDGTYYGSTTQDGGLVLIYLEAGGAADDAALRITLKKRG